MAITGAARMQCRLAVPAVILAALAFAPATSTMACTILLPRVQPSQDEIDRKAQNPLLSRGLIEVQTTREVHAGIGAVRILSVIRGDFRPGSIVQARALSSAECGPDRVAAGQRGFLRVYSSDTPIMIGQFVEPRIIESLRRQGLLVPIRPRQRR